MNTIQKSSEQTVSGEIRSRVSGLWKLLRKRPTPWQLPPEERLVQQEFGFAGHLQAPPRRR